jgi:hypothetical protein
MFGAAVYEGLKLHALLAEFSPWDPYLVSSSLIFTAWLVQTDGSIRTVGGIELRAVTEHFRKEGWT